MTKAKSVGQTPGTGKILAEHFEALLGRTASQDIAVNTQLEPGIWSMANKRNILFLTGTRADFGKLKPF